MAQHEGSLGCNMRACQCSNQQGHWLQHIKGCIIMGTSLTTSRQSERLPLLQSGTPL